MTNLTQYEAALAFITAGSLLLCVRYWRVIVALMLIAVFLKSFGDHNDER